MNFKLILIFFVFCCSESKDLSQKNDLVGDWMAIQHYYMNISALSDEDVEAIKAENISIKENGIFLFKQHFCYEDLKLFNLSELDSSVVDMNAYCNENNISMRSLELSSSQLLLCSGDSRSCYLDIVLKRNGNILIPYEGVFFEYKKLN